VFFSVLGRVAVWTGEGEQVLGPTREAALLADLLVHANHIVAADRLIDDLWHGAPPPAATAALHTYIKNLRRRVEPGRQTRVASKVLVSRRPGYQLVVQADGLDAWLAERSVQAGRDALDRGDAGRAQEHFREALALWKGVPFGDLAGEPFLRAETTRLEELRLAALEERARAALLLGDHAALCAELGTLVGEHPYRERLWELWMLALYRAGRQTDALRAYERLRRLLVEELGVDPSASVERLHRAILLHDPAIGALTGEHRGAAQPSTERPVTATAGAVQEAWAVSNFVPTLQTVDEQSSTAMVGRARERAALSAALDSARRSGRRHVVLIGGEPGIGKTTLAESFASAARGAGNLVVWARCDPEAAVPFEVWTTVVSEIRAHHAKGSQLAAVIAAHTADLAPLAPSFVRPADADVASPDAAALRYVLYAAVRNVLRTAAEQRPVVIVIDDLHWCDQPSLQLLRHLVSTGTTGPLLLVATYRTSERGLGHAFDELLTWLHLEPQVTRLTLEGLDVDDLTKLLEPGAAVSDDDDLARLCQQLARETDGNPFFVGELVRHLQETGTLARDGTGRWLVSGDLWQGGIPPSVREVISSRVTHLGPEAVRILSVAAVIGSGFDLDLLAASTDLAADDVLDILEAAVAAKLVVNDQRDIFRFAHALIGHALHDAQTPARRIRIHRSIAKALERRRAPNDLSHLADLAVHLIAACAGQAEPAELERAIGAAREAGDAAMGRLAPEDALEWYRQAVELLDRLPGDEPFLRCALMTATGDAQRQSGDPRSGDTLHAAAEFAREIGDTDTFVTAVLANSRGIYSSVGVVDQTRLEMLHTALQASGGSDSAHRARLLAQLAVESVTSVDHVERRALAAEAAAIGRRLDDPVTLLDVLIRTLEAVHVPDTLAERLAVTAEAERLARRLADRVRLFWSLFHRKFAAAEAVDPVEAERCHREATELAEVIGQPTLRWLNGLHVAWFKLLRGDVAGAERSSDETLQWGLSSGQPDALVLYQYQLHVIRWHQGRAGEVVELVENLAENVPLPLFKAATARVYVDIGRMEDARALMTEQMFRGFPHLQDLSYLATVSNWAEIAVRLRDDAAIDTLRLRLLPYADQLMCTHTSVPGAVAHYLGMLESAQGNHAAARVNLEKALDIHRAFQAPFHTARTHLELARQLRSMGAQFDDEAIAHATAARDVASEAGYAHVVDQAKEFLDPATTAIRSEADWC
jgi:DNA-binding SARP family transcriptional activator